MSTSYAGLPGGKYQAIEVMRLLQLAAHQRRVSVMNIAVAGQHPLKFIVQESFHRTDLLGPRVPRDAAKRSQRISFGRAGQMIAREQKLVFVKIDDVTACVPGSRNDEQIVVELDRIFATDNLLDAETACAIVCVHQSFAVEFLVKQLMRGDVVFVR